MCGAHKYDTPTLSLLVPFSHGNKSRDTYTPAYSFFNPSSSSSSSSSPSSSSPSSLAAVAALPAAALSLSIPISIGVPQSAKKRDPLSLLPPSLPPSLPLSLPPSLPPSFPSSIPTQDKRKQGTYYLPSLPLPLLPSLPPSFPPSPIHRQPLPWKVSSLLKQGENSCCRHHVLLGLGLGGKGGRKGGREEEDE